MTAHIITFPKEVTSDTNYRKAASILEKAPFSNDLIHNGLDGILIFTQQAIQELITDIDFCDNKHEASLYALRWSFDNLYQHGIPLEQHKFLNLCEDFIIPNEITSSENKTRWYNKY